MQKVWHEDSFIPMGMRFSSQTQAARSNQEPPLRGRFTEKKYLMFKKLTMIPRQKNLVDLDMLMDTELDWLDAYHEQVWKISALSWLMTA
jgi:hypothetical protein